MMFKSPWAAPVLVVLILSVAVFCFGFFVVLSANENIHKAYKAGYQHYYEAVPIHANPYRSNSTAKAWLDGWLRARNGEPEPK